MRHLKTEKIASLIWNANEDFINTMFVMLEEDIKDNAENRYKGFGIVIPDDLLQQYIERWFELLTKTNELQKFVDKNRPITNVKFLTTLSNCLRKLNTEKIAFLIWNADGDFINTMFVVAEEDIQCNAENRYECFGIVIPIDILQQYIERWFQRLTETIDLQKYIDRNRPMKNSTFRNAMCNYMRELNTEKITFLIWNAGGDFINTMFVMAEEDIKENAENRYECFGIVIPDDLLQQYIERWFERLTKTSGLEKYIDRNRPIKNETFRIALSDYLRKFNTEKIASLIWNAEGEFINTMLVMSEDVFRDNTGVLYECFGIVIPADLLQQYIERWFEHLTNTSELETFIDKNRSIRNVKFRTAVNVNMRQLNTDKIASLIWNAGRDFINTMFVMAEEDLNDNAENQYECFGIVIHNDLLQQYIERWFQRLTKTSRLEIFIDKNRPSKNVTFQNDIKANAENRYECFGIVIPDDLLHQYIERWFEQLTKTRDIQKNIDESRPIKNVTFHTALRNYMRHLKTEK
ncbi:unnamed protein product [Mytilus edulis]|uniref:Uncharacterized protein n=1 Tax=Mytilus edulis TaxID=6550 RepID=A0A8S3QSB6_MYTED|nr:unnamed protein product [Mytilus edulis]